MWEGRKQWLFKSQTGGGKGGREIKENKTKTFGGWGKDNS